MMTKLGTTPPGTTPPGTMPPGGHPPNPASPAVAPRASRRGLLAAAGGLAASVGTGFAARAVVPEAAPNPRGTTEDFWGAHQGGIVTPSQSHTYFAAFDLTAAKREDLVKLLQVWTDAAARMTSGDPAGPPMADPEAPGSDSATRSDWPQRASP